MPTHKNRRIKTDRRDAVRLAHFLRSGDLVEVTIPQAQTEAMRDLERAREDAIQVERVARQQLDKFLLRHGRRHARRPKVRLQWHRAQRTEMAMLTIRNSGNRRRTSKLGFGEMFKRADGKSSAQCFSVVCTSTASYRRPLV